MRKLLAGVVAALTVVGSVALAQTVSPMLGTSSTYNKGTSGGTVPLLNGANTWGAVQTYTNSDISLLGSSTGATTFTSDNAGASNFTLHVPAANDTLADLAGAQAFTNKTYNGNTWTAGTGTLTISAGKTFTDTGNLTFSGTDGSTLNIGSGGTLGTAAFQNTGTSGATVPLLSTANSWSDSQNLATGKVLSWNSDVGLSRSAAGVLLLGNGTAGDAVAEFRANQTCLGNWPAAGVSTYLWMQNCSLDQTVYGNYAILESSAGDTAVNAASGRVLALKIGNSDVVNVASNYVDIRSGVPLTWNADTGISRDAAATIDFGNSAQGDTSALLQAKGLNLGLTAAFNPTFPLIVTNNHAGETTIQVNNSDGGTGSYASMQVHATGTLEFGMTGNGFTPSGNILANMGFIAANQAGGLLLETSAAQPVYMGVNGLEVARFISTGLALTNSSQLTVAAMTQTSAIQSGTMCYNLGTGAVTYDSTLGCLASLEELKILDGPITGALEETMKLKPFWGSWKHDTPEWKGGDHGHQPFLGAHATEKVDHRLVGYGPDGKLRGVRYAEMTALLTAALQEQQKEIQTLNARIVKLEAANDNLRKAFK